MRKMGKAETTLRENIENPSDANVYLAETYDILHPSGSNDVSSPLLLAVADRERLDFLLEQIGYILYDRGVLN